MVKELSSTLEARGFQISVISWTFAQVDGDSIYVILDSGDHPLLADRSEAQFMQITKLLTQGSNVFWITVPESSLETMNPETGILTGFARVARSENENLRLITFDAQCNIGSESARLVKMLSDTMTKSFYEGTTRAEELEYVYRDGKLLIPRLIPDNIPVSCKTSSGYIPNVTTCNFHQSNRPLRLCVENPGLLDSFIFVDQEVARKPLPENKVEIQVKACGINFRDVLIALGQMKPSSVMADECSGIVTAVGSGCQEDFQVGDRVCTWNGTPYASTTRLDSSNAYPIPGNMTFPVAASMPVVFITAYYSLVDISGLQKGQSLLIHAMSGGVGQAAIMIAQYIGADIFVTAGSLDKRRLIREKFNIPESHIFSTRSRNFKSGVLKLTENKGLDVILNSLSGEALQNTWDCIAKFRTFVEIGKTDIYRRSTLNMEPFDKYVKFASVDLLLLSQHKSKKLRAIFAQVVSLFENGALQPVYPITVLPINEIESAFRLIQARKHTGKIVLEANLATMVKSRTPSPTPLKLDEKCSYLIAGGLGAVGFEVCRLMAIYGAKNIIILSRRQRTLEERNKYMCEIEAYGAKVRIITCDITDSVELQKTISYCQETLPPIRGIIQAAMVLQVSIRGDV